MSEPPSLTNDQAATWFRAAVPEGWFSSIRALVDRDEIMIIGVLDGPPPDPDEDAVEDEAESPAEEGNEPNAADGVSEARELHAISSFREHTRDERIAIAQRAEAKFRRKVAWATQCGRTQATFSHLNVPVMTRLRIDERHVLDTLVAAGAARSRSDALVWCVRQVAELEGEWLDELRAAIETVDAVRAKGPG